MISFAILRFITFPIAYKNRVVFVWTSDIDQTRQSGYCSKIDTHVCDDDTINK